WLLSAACTISCAPRGSAPIIDNGYRVDNSGVARVAPVGNLLKASNFDDGVGLPWMTSFTPPADGAAEVKQGALCVSVANAGTNNWDAQFRHREIVIRRGHAYAISFKAWSSAATQARLKVGMSGPPYGEYWSDVIELSAEPKQFSGSFTMREADDA